jgi:hypothetical protein
VGLAEAFDFPAAVTSDIELMEKILVVEQRTQGSGLTEGIV